MIDFIKSGGLDQTKQLNHTTFYLSVCTKQKRDRSCICMLGISILPISATAMHLLLFILFLYHFYYIALSIYHNSLMTSYNGQEFGTQLLKSRLTIAVLVNISPSIILVCPWHGSSLSHAAFYHISFNTISNSTYFGIWLVQLIQQERNNRKISMVEDWTKPSLTTYVAP